MSNVRFGIEVGKQVLLMPIGNAARRWDGKLIPGEVTQIGRKYFYVKVNGISWKEEQFDRQTFECHNSDCNSGYVLYETEAEYAAEKERNEMLLRIRQYFGFWGGEKPSYKATEEIHDILMREGLI